MDSECFVKLERIRRDLMSKLALGSTMNHPFANVLFGESLKQHMKNEEISILEWLILTDQFKSTLCRDKVYALLGLSSQASYKGIVPDYSRDISDAMLLTRLTAHFLIQMQSSLPLQCGTHRQADIGHAPLSWVCNWYTARTDCVPLIF